jgi:hypothetical protein
MENDMATLAVVAADRVYRKAFRRSAKALPTEGNAIQEDVLIARHILTCIYLSGGEVVQIGDAVPPEFTMTQEHRKIMVEEIGREGIDTILTPSEG